MVIKHFGKVLGNKPIFTNFDRYKEAIKSLEGKDFELVIKEKSKRVSQDQHGYYRKAIISTALEFEMFGGWDNDMVHSYFASLFLSEYKTVMLGDKQVSIKTITSTSSLNRKEMSNYINNCIIWLANNGIVVLDSSQYLIEKYK